MSELLRKYLLEDELSVHSLPAGSRAFGYGLVVGVAAAPSLPDFAVAE